MPWKVSHVVTERMNFIVRVKNGERMSELCREYGISRKTGYKFLERFERLGASGLEDQRRAPIRQAHRTSAAMEKQILQLKTRYASWGARKLRERLLRTSSGDLRVPSVLTIHRILAKHGRVETRKSRRSQPAFRSEKIRQTTQPNQIWAMDFKGQFRTQDQKLCYPLTLTDHYSRYVLACEALEDTRSLPVEGVLRMLFEEQGLPEAILSDNGCPFGAVGLFGLSRISVWLLRLEVDVLRIEPGHPEQNGRHERMHLSLKRATTRPSARNLLQQQERFEHFKHEYNFERPHEALGMKTPSEVWAKPKRTLPGQLPEPDYSAHDLVRIVYESGLVALQNGTKFHLSKAFAGQPIALTEEDDGLWRVSFMRYDLGFVDAKNGTFKPVEALNLSPM